MTVFTWVVIAGLIAVNALYVAAEFAAVSVRRGRVRQLAEEGSARARQLLPVLEDARRLDRYVAACQIGITLSSLVLGAFGQATLARQLGPLFVRLGAFGEAAAQSTAAVIVLVGLTALQVVLGELVPKSLALQYPTQAALSTVLPMRWSLWLFAGFIAVLNGSGLLVLRLLGVSEAGHRHIHSPDEIDLLIAESRNGGLLEPDEQRRLRRALRLGTRRVHQLMVPRTLLAMVKVDRPPDDVLREVTGGPYTRLPVYEGSPDNIIGLLHTKDLVARYVEQGTIGSLREVIRPALAVPESLTAEGLLRRFREERTQQAVVVDEYGGVAGLVTLEDVLAEVLGEVGDEFKRAETHQARPVRLPDGRVRLPGLLRLDEAEPWLGVLWQGEADTIGGRVVEALGHLPEPGEQATINGVVVEVEGVAHHAVTSVLATPAPPRPKDVDEDEDGLG